MALLQQQQAACHKPQIRNPDKVRHLIDRRSTIIVAESCRRSPAKPILTHPIPMPQTMRFIVLSSAIILVACLFPQNGFALLAYVCITSYAILVTVDTTWKAPPHVKRQALIASSGAVAVALGVGIYIYLN